MKWIDGECVRHSGVTYHSIIMYMYLIIQLGYIKYNSVQMIVIE